MPRKRANHRTTAGFSINIDTLNELKKYAKEKGTNVSNLIEKFAEQIINEKNEKKSNTSNKKRND